MNLIYDSLHYDVRIVCLCVFKFTFIGLMRLAVDNVKHAQPFFYDMLVSNEYAFELIDAFFYYSANFDTEHKNSRNSRPNP